MNSGEETVPDDRRSALLGVALLGPVDNAIAGIAAFSLFQRNAIAGTKGK